MRIIVQSESKSKMSGLCVTGRDGKIVLSRAKYREIGTGIIEAASKDARSEVFLDAPASAEFVDLDSTLGAVALFASEAVDDQLKQDAGIDIDQADASQVRSLVWHYVEAFAREMQNR
jgi:hypothetical protein